MKVPEVNGFVCPFYALVSSLFIRLNSFKRRFLYPFLLLENYDNVIKTTFTDKKYTYTLSLTTVTFVLS